MLARLERAAGLYSGGKLTRLALTADDIQTGGLPGFEADTKASDSRYQWFVRHYGTQCWEVDALSPPLLRARLETAILRTLDAPAWDRAETTERAERASMQAFFRTWKPITGQVQK